MVAKPVAKAKSKITRGASELMRNDAETAGSAVQTPEVLLAVSGMREESLVLAFEICSNINN